MWLAKLRAKSAAIGAHRNGLLRRWLVTLAIGMLITWAVWQFVSRPTTLTIAVGPADSERARFLTAVADRLKAARKPVRLKIVLVKDGAEAGRRLNSDAVDLAVLRSDQSDVTAVRSFAIIDRRAVLLIAAADPVKPKPKPAAAVPSAAAAVAVAAVPAAAATPVAQSSDDADDAETPPTPGPLSPERLLGRRLVIASDSFGFNRETVGRLLAHSGLGASAITLSEVPATEIARALEANRGDVAVLVIDPTSETARRLVGDIARAFGGPIVVGPPPAPEALAAIHRNLSTIEVQQGVLGGPAALPAQKFTTVALTEELVGDSDIEESTGAQLTKALLEVRGRLTAMADQSFEIETPPLDALRRFMPHAGVSAHVNERSTTFLEKYSDQIWLALFGLGLVGSSIAGFAGRLGLFAPAGVADPLPRDVERLLGGIAAAASPADVDTLRRELRALAATRLRQAMAEGLEASDASHPSQWFPLIDALAASRRDELGTGGA